MVHIGTKNTKYREYSNRVHVPVLDLHRAGIFSGVRLIYSATTMEVVDFIELLGGLD
uniref:Uncharacterized protein n=1 Tax=Romanomermis culicivorax TaxID=13658 RepID=A0A915HJR4_ROMCU